MSLVRFEQLKLLVKFGCVRCLGTRGPALIRAKEEGKLRARLWCQHCWALECEYDALLRGDLNRLSNDEMNRRLDRCREIEDTWRKRNMNTNQPPGDIGEFLLGIGRGVLKLGVDYLKSELEQTYNDMANLDALGKQLGIPRVPGEDLQAYRAKVIAARDKKVGA